MSAITALHRTPLYAIHKELGARLVDFHGWELPIQFTSILKEHQAVRATLGLFDVSHMGQIFIEGPQALEFLQRVNSNDASLAVGAAMYSHLLNERGGVVDDVIVCRLAVDRFFIVVNAATADKDFAWLKLHASDFTVTLFDRSAEYGMLALQGPQAATVMAQILPQAVSLKRFGVLECLLYGQPVLLLRTGYTGEDGFEVAAPSVIVPRIWENMMATGASFGILPCGLGARDTLRLEAGYLLYGQDIDEEHTPLEANYAWVVKFGKKDFIGKRALEIQKQEGIRRKLLGIQVMEKGVPRPGSRVGLGNDVLGELSSATFSPTLQTGIGMGYMKPPDIRPGAQAWVEIHGRRLSAQIVEIPFYKRDPRKEN